jgi:hypothetical protein
MSELIDRLGLKLVHLAYRYGQMIEDVAGGNFEFAVSSVGSSSAQPSAAWGMRRCVRLKSHMRNRAMVER